MQGSQVTCLDARGQGTFVGNHHWTPARPTWDQQSGNLGKLAVVDRGDAPRARFHGWSVIYRGSRTAGAAAAPLLQIGGHLRQRARLLHSKPIVRSIRAGAAPTNAPDARPPPPPDLLDRTSRYAITLPGGLACRPALSNGNASHAICMPVDKVQPISDDLNL